MTSAIRAGGLGAYHELGSMVGVNRDVLRSSGEPLREPATLASAGVECAQRLVENVTSPSGLLVGDGQDGRPRGVLSWLRSDDPVVFAQRTRTVADVFHAGDGSTAGAEGWQR